MEKFIPWYPSIDEKDFREMLWNKREFFELKYMTEYNRALISEEYIHSSPKSYEKKVKSFLYPHQMFIEAIYHLGLILLEYWKKVDMTGQ